MSLCTIAHLSNWIGDTLAVDQSVQKFTHPGAIELTSLSDSPEAVMSIKVLLVDGSAVMRSAIRQLFKNELGIEVIGIATSFAETIVLTAALKPDVLLMDPHMPDEREFNPALLKSQILSHTKCIVAMSLWRDADTKALAETFGAHVLLDKMNLYSELIPAIKQFCPGVSIPKTARSLRNVSSSPASVPMEAILLDSYTG
jgi:DNA-binding NarL/FixJ family response regulator